MLPRKDYLVFGAPDIRPPEIDAIVEVMKSGWIGTGPRVFQFERDFATYKGVAEAATVFSCTAALHLSLLAAGIGDGDEVITTAMTFCATVNAIIHAGGTPVLCDIDPGTLNLDPKSVEKRITSKTKAILPVHFAGRPCDMNALMKLADQHHLKVIEDCAHAIETEFRGQKAGTFGDFGCFSFYVTKNVTTAEGGIVITKDPTALSKIRILRLHGLSKDAWKRFGDDGYKHYGVVAAGFKQNMTDLQAAIGIEQLKRVEESWNRRKEIWQQYQAAFEQLAIGLPAEPDAETRHGYHLYTLMIDPAKCGITRDGFLQELHARKIGSGVHYLSIPEHSFYRESFGWKLEDYPHAFKVGRETLSIPLGSNLSAEDVNDVIEAVRSILASR